MSSGAGSCTTPSGHSGRKEAWCAQFTRWVYRTAGAGNYDKMDAGAVSVTRYGTWKPNSTKSPHVKGIQPGDLVGYRLYSGSTADDHVGVVVSVSGSGYTSVEGNVSGAVRTQNHSFTESIISGYATPVAR